jgi:hypothetical protein
MTRFITKKYKDDSTIASEWCLIMDGEWPYGDNCKEVIYVMNINNPLYE